MTKKEDKKENISEDISKGKDADSTTKTEITCEEKIKLLEKEIEDLKNDYLRSRADFDNFRKRKEVELLENKDRVIVNFVEDLLPAIENFEMSLKMTENQKMFVKGVEMIHKNLVETLKSHKFEHFEPKIGDEFNPYSHEAILIEDKSAKPNKVISVMKKGYTHKGKIIKPAKVTILKEEDKSSK